MTNPITNSRRHTDFAVSAVSGGVLLAFVIAALVAPQAVDNGVTALFTPSARWFGPMWQVLLLGTFLIAVGLAFSRYGQVRLGAQQRPEFSRFKWVAMIMSTLLAAGGVFFAAGEPLQHYTSTPPYYEGTQDGPRDALVDALAQTFTHWGFLSWAILGALGTIVMMRGVERGMPLRPRTLLYPLMGERVRHSKIGTIVDIICIIAVVAGTVGPIGFLGLQVSYGMSQIFGTPNTYPVQVAIIVTLTAIAVLSAVTGIDKGIQFLSRMNLWLAIALVIAFLALGSIGFVLDAFLGGFAQYVNDFTPLALFRGNEEWLGSWTVFFFGWFVGYAPMMSMFVARISRGRTLRDLMISTSIVPPVATALWFTVFGGTGILFEQRTPGSISGPLNDVGMDAAVISIAHQLPFGNVLAVFALVLTIIFVATTTDTMSYSVAAAGSWNGQPKTALRAFWGMLMGAGAAALIVIGDGGITALQNFIVVTAVPVGFIMLPTLWTAPRVARDMAVEQGVVAAASTSRAASADSGEPTTPPTETVQPMSSPDREPENVPSA